MPSKFRKKVKEGLSKARRPKVAAAIGLLVVVCLFLYASDWFMFDFLDAVNGSTVKSPLLGKARMVLFKAQDELNPFRAIDFSRFEDIPHYELTLSANDASYFIEASEQSEEAGYRTEFAADWRSVVLEKSGKKYDVRMSLFGDTPSHYQYVKKSFKVKSPRDEFIDGKRRLSFIRPEERSFFMPIFGAFLAGELGLFAQKYEVAAVSINGMPQGLYLVEEGLDQHFMERNSQPGTLVLSYRDNWIEDHPVSIPVGVSPDALPANNPFDYSAGVTFDAVHNTPFDLEISNVKELDAENGREVMYRVGELFEAAESNDQEVFESLVDEENVAAVQAMIALFGNPHDFTGDNLRLFYDITTGEFGFVPRIESFILPIKIYRGGIDKALSTEAVPVPLLRYTLRNPELRNLRNEKIYELLQRKEHVLEGFMEVDGRYRAIMLSDVTNTKSSRIASRELDSQFSSLQGNMALLERMFEYSKAYVNVVKEGNALTVEVVPDSATALRFKEFSIGVLGEEGNVVEVKVFDGAEKLIFENKMETQTGMNLANTLNQNLLQAGLGEDMEPVLTRFRYEFLFEKGFELGQVNALVENAITVKELAADDVYISVAVQEGDYSGLEAGSMEEFLEMFGKIGFEGEGDELRLPEGEYLIEEDVLVPKGLKLVLEPGVEIKVAEGISFVSYSSLDALGTREKPIEVRALEERKPFGVFAVLGDGKETRVRLKNFEISGGSERFFNGVFFSGQLSVYHADLEMVDSRVEASVSDDGLNAKYGNVLIEDTVFSGNMADQVDLDFCEGIVKDSEFSIGDSAESGDGLDVSGSRILVKNSVFEGMQDKGISIGEESWVLAYGNDVWDNNLGAAVKDGSKAFFVENDFERNIIAVSAYEKKPLFVGADFWVKGNLFLENGQSFEVDGKSGYYLLPLSGEELREMEQAIAEDNLELLEAILPKDGGIK
jgi:hypothetical protein